MLSVDRPNYYLFVCTLGLARFGVIFYGKITALLQTQLGFLMPHLTELTWTQTTVYPVVQLTDLCCQILCSLSVSFHILPTWDESGISDSQNPAKLLSAAQSDRGALSGNRWEQLTQTRVRTMIPVTCIKKQTAAYGVYSRINVSSGTKAWGRGLPGQGRRLGQSA